MCQRSQFGIQFVACACLVVLSAGLLVAQRVGQGARPSAQRPAPQQPNSENRNPNLVTVTKADGSTLRGEVVSSDPEQLVFKPARKPTDTADPEQLNIPWKEIKKVSNGLTQQKALEAWKQEHREQLCETCHGDHTLLCTVCKGTLHDPASAKDCKTCKGELLVACKTPKCKEGVMPCPATCLKLTEGNWVTKPDGMKWRTFRSAKGGHEWSQNHLGELVVMENGEWVNKGKCPTCGGKMQIECPACRGLGKVPCATCLARSDAPACTNSCDHGRSSCETCKGTGLKS